MSPRSPDTLYLPMSPRSPDTLYLVSDVDRIQAARIAAERLQESMQLAEGLRTVRRLPRGRSRRAASPRSKEKPGCRGTPGLKGLRVCKPGPEPEPSTDFRLWQKYSVHGAIAGEASSPAGGSAAGGGNV